MKVADRLRFLPTKGLNAPREVVGKTNKWLDWWVAVRLRAFVCWVILALIAATALKENMLDWLDTPLEWMAGLSQEYLGFAPPTMVVQLFNGMALLCWYQPVLLRLAPLRCVLWVIAYGLLSWGAFAMQGPRFGPNWVGFSWGDIFFGGNAAGIPGLVAIGALRRGWLSIIAGVLSCCALLLIRWNAQAPNFPLGIAYSQAVYAAVMVWGTRRITATEEEGFEAQEVGK